jgi:hypothetical protein
VNRKFIIGTFMCSFLVSGLLASALTVGHAQSRRGEAQAAPQQSDEDACEPDVMKLCKRVSKSGDLIVLKCLQQNRKKLGKACQKVLQDHGV